MVPEREVDPTASPSATKEEVTIRAAQFPAEREAVAGLFTAYARSLPISLDFQNFDAELNGLPGKYAAAEGGAVYLACVPASAALMGPADVHDATASPSSSVREHVIGCVALRALDPPAKCELKRLYLAPASRRLGIGGKLMDAVTQRARQLGYKYMLLDTLSSMKAAQSMYVNYGFVEVDKYYESVEDAVFYLLALEM